MATITINDVKNIINEMQAEGLRPTLRSIRERHGSGSLGTIHRLMNEVMGNGSASKVKAEPVELPENLVKSIAEYAGTLINEKTAEMACELEEARQTINDLVKSDERKEFEIESMKESIRCLEIENAELKGQVRQVKSENEAMKEITEAARVEAEKYRIKSETTEAVAVARTEAEKEKLEDAKEQVRKLQEVTKAKSDEIETQKAQIIELKIRNEQMTQEVKVSKDAMEAARVEAEKYRIKSETTEAVAATRAEAEKERLENANKQIKNMQDQIKTLSAKKSVPTKKPVTKTSQT